MKRKNFPRVIGGLGIAVISTSSGVMSDKQAREGLADIAYIEIMSYVSVECIEIPHWHMITII